MSFIRFFIPLTFEIKKTMLVTTADEIRAYLPTSVYSGDDSLLALMEDTEESVLVPVLGRELYEKVCEDYEKTLLPKYGSSDIASSRWSTSRWRTARASSP